MNRLVVMWFLCVICIAPQAQAQGQIQTATLLRADAMRTEPYTDSMEIASLAPGAKVTLLERKGTWARVSREGSTGWLRGLNLKADDARGLIADGVLALSTGREGRGGIAVPLGIRAPGPGPGLQVFEDLFQHRDKDRRVTLSARKTEYRIGKDAIELSLASERGGFAYVYMVDRRAGVIHCLFPNADAHENQLAPGGTLRVPGGAAAYSPTVPRGELVFLAVVADTPLDLLLPEKQANGPYFSLPATAESRNPLAAALAGRLAPCANARCTDYGAASLVIDAK
jgi:hypothetical protein